MKIEGLSDAAIVAVGKLVNDKESSAASAKLSAGQHNVDFTIRVSGTLNRGENYSQQVVAKADFALLFAVALSHLNGPTVESIVRESLAYDPALVDSLKEIAAKAVAQIKETTMTPCNGKTTAALIVSQAGLMLSGVSTVGDSFTVLMAISFEAGRLYGRTEALEEIGGVKE